MNDGLMNSGESDTKGRFAPESLLPHRRRMLLICDILSFDGQKAVTRAVAAGHWPLTDESGANGIVLIELVAQTAGVNNGWTLMQEKGPDVDHRGWIVGIKQARLYVETVPLGAVIETASENTFAYENLREVRGTVRIDGRLAAEVTLQLMQANEDGI
jgi:predicted hotdog family 3-hydroxylacyl-ACP dehydratase